MIRTVVVDDSATMRALLTTRLSRESDIAVVGSAADAREAREMIRALDPDVITLDIEMPGMNGLDFLAKIMELKPKPVIVVSGATREGADATVRALSLGAVHCYAKEHLTGAAAGDRDGLAALVREAALTQLQRPMPAVRAGPRPEKGAGYDLVAIGSSTGGVEALHNLLATFPADGPPALIVQHVDASFAPAIARSLDSHSPARVVLAEPGVPLARGHVYLAPGDDRHLTVNSAGQPRASLRPGAPMAGHIPSVDALFHSVAQRADLRCAGALLTGMGRDGADGLLAMKTAGHRTIAQDRDSCTVFGMPRAAIEQGAADRILPLGGIANALMGARA